MNKLEYIPGDLVMVDGINETIYKIEDLGSQPHSDDFLYTLIPIGTGAIIFDLPANHIYSIPLTPEILEKNRWKKDKEGYINNSYHLHLCGKHDEYSVYKVVNDNVVWLTGVRSVSDLQHLLFGLGLNSEMEV